MEIICNPLTDKDLLEELGTISYHRVVTEDDFWLAVGERLAQRRKKAMPVSEILKRGGPTNKTVQEIESGNIKQLTKLRDYARIVEVDLIDLFRSVLKVETEAYSPELEYVIRQFNAPGDAGVIARSALVATARLGELSVRSKEALSGQPNQREEKRRAKTSTAKRRAAK